MDESSLRTLINSLDSQQDSLAHSLNICAAFVVIGVAAEIVFVIWEYRSQRNDWRRGTGFLHSPRPPNFIKLILELIGVLLVSGGVAGEFFVDRKAGVVETQLRKANADLVLLLGQKVQDAATSAHNASIDAGTAQTKANAVGEQASRLDDMENKLNADVVSADLIMSADASGHFFLPSVFNSLSKFPGNVSVTWLLGTRPSSILFAQKLSIALQSMGWHISAPPHVFDRIPPGSSGGVIIYSKWWQSPDLPYPTAAHRDMGFTPDMSLLDESIGAAHKDLTTDEVFGLVRLFSALNAKMDIEPSLPADSVVVVVGDVQQ
jgi:hypothetical protein